MDDIPHIIEVSLFLVLAFLVGCVLGFLARKIPFFKTNRSSAGAKTKASDFEPKSDTPKAPDSIVSKNAASIAHTETMSGDEPEKQEAMRPASLQSPRNDKPDNLKKIKGIGPKIESGLHELGVYHYDQIANWDSQTIGWVDDRLSLKGRIDRDGWVEQASALARDE